MPLPTRTRRTGASCLETVTYTRARGMTAAAARKRQDDVASSDRLHEQLALECAHLLNGSLSLDDVARRIRTRLVSAAAQSDDNEAELWATWNAIISVAVDTRDDAQEPLLSLVRKLRGLPLGSETKKVWQLGERCAYPLLGPAMRETLDVCSEDATQYVNFCAFFAKLTSMRDEQVDLSLYCLWIARDAFEEANPSDATLQAAAVVLRHASDVVWANSLARLDQPDRMGVAGASATSSLPKETRGFSLERWQFWKNSLERLCRENAPNDDTTRALLAMRAAES